MSDLKNHYQAIITELENHFQNEDDQAFVLSKFQELSMMFMDVIDRLTYRYKNKRSRRKTARN